MRRMLVLMLAVATLSAACARQVRNPQAPKGPEPVRVPGYDAVQLARCYRLIEEGKLTSADLAARDVREGATAEVSRTLAELCLAEIHYRKKSYDAARELAQRHLASGFAEAAADAHFIAGKIALAQGDYEEARRRFDQCRKISRDAGLALREARVKEYISFTEGLMMIDKGSFAEGREILQSVNDPELRVIVGELFNPE